MIKNIGSQKRESLKDSGYKLIELSFDKKTAILDLDGKREVWGLNNHYAGYVIEIYGQGYEFVSSRAAAPAAETVGRTYSKTRFGVHSRKVCTEGWYGLSTYKTLDEARDALNKCGKRFENVGGITVDFGPATDLREYRIVKEESQVIVLEVEFKKV